MAAAIFFHSPLRARSFKAMSLVRSSPMSFTQNFAYSMRKTLRVSSGILFAMSKRLDLNLILAHNLDFFMKRSELYTTPRALGIAAGVAPNTVSNYLDHKKRTVTAEKPEGFPTLDRLANLASRLECEVWELLHPDIERSIREREMYSKIMADFTAATVLSASSSRTLGVESDRLGSPSAVLHPPKPQK